MLSVSGLNQYYGESHILWDVNLEAAKNACTCVMGRNGVGKTTLLKCLMGLLPTRSGRVILEGVDITAAAPGERARRGLGYVPQGRQIFPLLTVRENLAIGLPIRKDRAREIPPFIYDFFPVLKDMSARRGGDLSGGQQQQLAIGRALALDPSVLILDEPTEGIQPNLVQDIAKAIRRLCREMGMTVILVEQKLPFARNLADSFVILDRGHVVKEGRMAGLDSDAIRDFLTV
ncbi:MAG: urea ABC transporter ATP-binding subunit UrtE [Planctomycetota bacterium]|jgi:urea transport system ATP-binding protein|nr:urea ABC transporter ATP-binding subunit UrtE [Planctomycetota bacterium]